MQNSHTKIHILGGNNNSRIGASSQLIEHENEWGNMVRILIDLGALFPSSHYANTHFVPPVTQYLGYNPPKNGNNPRLKTYHQSIGGKKEPQIDALFLTHMHEDHIGGIVSLLKAGFTFPTIYGSNETLHVLAHLLIEEGVENLPELCPIKNAVAVSKDMIVTPFSVSHTTLGSFGYHILTKTNQQNEVGIIHLGDFNLSDILIGEGYQQDQFNHFLNTHYVTHVLTDSTSVSNKLNQELSFKESIENWQDLMQQTDKRIITAVISRSTQNMAPIILAAKKAGRKVFIDGYMQKIIYNALQKMGALEDFSDTVYHHSNILSGNLSAFTKESAPKNQVVIFSGAFAEGFYCLDEHSSGLARVAKQSHQNFLLNSSSLVVLSQRAIPVDDIPQAMREMAFFLAKQNGNNLIQNQTSDALSLGNYPMKALQRTGHATFREMITMLSSIKHQRLNKDDKLTIIPLHGDKAQLKNATKCAKLIKAETVLAENGDYLALLSDGIQTIINSSQRPWLSFKTQKTTKTNSFEINLVQEAKENRGKNKYELLARLGGGNCLIPQSQKKQLLFNIMQTTLARKMER